jgi:hypothetical protein
VGDPTEILLEKLDPQVRALVQELRALIKEVMPQVSEKAHLGWSAWHYRAGATMKDVVVAISPQRTYANLEFGDGVDLPDPKHRLEGTGKRLRHVKIRRVEDVRDPDVRNLLEVAARRRGV